VPNRFQNKIADGAAEFLEPQETVLAAMSAAVKGRAQTISGSGLLGHHQIKKTREAAESLGVTIPGGTVGLVVTNQRLLILQVGLNAKVKSLASSIPVSQVSEVTVKRMGLGGTTTVIVGDAELKFEGQVGAGREVADAVAKAKAG
jgi:hypothetical protein